MRILIHLVANTLGNGKEIPEVENTLCTYNLKLNAFLVPLVFYVVYKFSKKCCKWKIQKNDKIKPLRSLAFFT